MKNILLALGAAAGALCTTLPAHAITLESASLNGNLLDSAFSTPSLIALDLTLLNHAPLRFSFVVDADDVGRGWADFNAIVRDVGGLGIGSLTPSLTMSVGDIVAPSQRTSMPTRTSATTMPVSWQIGRRPSAHRREFARICAIASFAAGLSSAAWASPSASR